MLNYVGGIVMSYSEKTLGEFTDELASSSPVPGGGGSSALVGSVGTALASMVCNLTTGKKKYAQYEADIKRILSDCKKLQRELLAQIDEDAKCFEPLSKAYSLSKDNPERDNIMEDALRLACTAPLSIMKIAGQVILLHSELAVKGSTLMQSDVGVGILCCKTALKGASLNVYINIRSMKDRVYAENLKSEVDELLEKYCKLADETYSTVTAKLIGGVNG